MSAPHAPPYRVVIVGAGASGTLVAIALLRSQSAPLVVTLVEHRADQVGRGIAYRDGSPLRPLNVAARSMSAYEETPLHFVRWLGSRAEARGSATVYGSDDFVPRNLYGEYLREELERARRESTHASSIVVDEVIDVVARDGRHAVRLGSGRTPIGADCVVLAYGHGLHPPQRGDALPLSQPFTPGVLDALKRDDDVLFIGSGLTTIDHLLVLEGRGHRGKCFVVSRHGLWPRPHAPCERIAIASTVIDAHSESPRTLLRWLRTQANESTVPWQALIDALRPHVPSIWARWGARDRRAFLEHLRTHWEIHRHRVPLASGRVVSRLREDGRLVTLAGRVVSCEETAPGRFVTTLLDRRSHAPRRIESHLVVRCTGPIADHRASTHPLMRQLIARGAIVPDAHGLGIETAPDGGVLGRDDIASRSLVTLGPPRRASLYESTGLPEIRRQAHDLAAAIEQRARATSRDLAPPPHQPGFQGS